MSVYYNRSTNSGAKVPTILTKHTKNVQRYHLLYKLGCISSVAQKQTTIACKKLPTFSIWAGHANIVPKAETTLKMKSREDA